MKKWGCYCNKYGRGFETGVLAEAARILRCILEKAYIAMNQQLRAILVRALKGKRRVVKKILIFLQNIYGILHVMLVEIL